MSRLPKVHASILAGPDLKIIDVSPSGLLVETDVRLIPGAGICLTIKFENESHMVGGRVARVDTALVGNRMKYRAGIALDGVFAPFDLPAPEDRSSEAAGAPASRPKNDGPDSRSVPAGQLGQSGVDALRQALDEQRRNHEHGQRTIEMLKAALRGSEGSRRQLEEECSREREAWQKERHTLEQALEIAARHKEKLSAELTAAASREKTLTRELEEERAAALSQRVTLQEQLEAANGRADETVRELEALRDSNRCLERTLDEERAMLAGLLEEKERLLAQLEVLRTKLEILSQERERLDDDRCRSDNERERLAKQLDAAERWCADQHELIYELWQQTLRSTSLIEGWKSSHRRQTPASREQRPARSDQGEAVLPAKIEPSTDDTPELAPNMAVQGGTKP